MEQKVLTIEEKKKIIVEKGQSKDWQEKEIAMREMQFLFSESNSKLLLSDSDFMQSSLMLLKACLEDNNMTIYLLALEVAQLYFPKTLHLDLVNSQL